MSFALLYALFSVKKRNFALKAIVYEILIYLYNQVSIKTGFFAIFNIPYFVNIFGFGKTILIG